MTRALFDTNVLLDSALVRQPFSTMAAAAMNTVEQGQVEGLVSGHAVTTIWYVIERQLDAAQARRAVGHLLARFGVAAVTGEVLRMALAMPMPDFEDAVTAIAANEAGADLIVTRDAGGFAGSPVPAVLPEAFLARL